MKEKKFGNFRVSKYSMSFVVGDCSLDDDDIENLREALKQYDKNMIKLNKRLNKNG